MKEKMITIKVPDYRVRWIKDDFKNSPSKVFKALFEYGTIDIKEAHALADIVRNVDMIFKIEEDS
jgi:hypothetical protein